MEPITRKEVFLNAMCADKPCALEPVSREEILLKRLVEAEANEGGGSGLPSGAKPNQYIVTDGEGKVGWEDKLCWSEKEVYLEERTLSFQEQGGMFIAQVEQFDMPIDFDATYTVVWDGKEYDCPVVESAFGDASLGNPNLVVMPSDLGEPDTSMSVPFLCVYMYIDGNDKSSGMLGVLATTGGERTIGIFRNVAKKIHPDFLPTGVPYISEEKVEVNKDNFSIYEGEVYEVIHKGLAYRCVCKRLDYWGFSAETVFYIGNAETTDEIFGYGEDCTGEPFCYHTSVDDFGHSVTKSFGSENVTAIYKVNRVRVGGSGGSGGGCLVITQEYGDDYEVSGYYASMTYEDARELLQSGAATSFRQIYSDGQVQVYSNTKVVCHSNHIYISVYDGSGIVAELTFNSDGTIGIAMEG